MFRLPGKIGWQLWRRPSDRLPRAGDAALVFLVCFAAVVYVGPLFARIKDPSAMTRAQIESARLGILGQQICLLLLPVAAYSFLLRFDLKRTFRLRRPGLRNLFLSALIGLSGFVLLAFIVQVQAALFEDMKKVLKDFERLMTPLASGNLAAPVLVFAVLPAICEETLFRGLMLTSFSRGRRITGILVTAMLFGLMHFERSLHTFLLGLVLAYAVLRTGSILTGMAIHFVNNVTALVAFRLEKTGAIMPEEISMSFVFMIVLVAVITFAASVCLLSTGPGEETEHQ